MLTEGQELTALYRDIAAGRRRLVGWGATGDLRYALFQLAPHPVAYVVDADPAKWGSRVQGVEIAPPERLVGEDPASTAVMVFPHQSAALPAILDTIRALGDFPVMPPFRIECDRPFGAGIPDTPWVRRLRDLSDDPVAALGRRMRAVASPPVPEREGVALVSEYLTLGGSERQICRLAAGLGQVGLGPRLLVPGPPQPDLEGLHRLLRTGGVPVNHLPQPRDDWTGDPCALAGPDPEPVMRAVELLPPEMIHRVLALRSALLARPPALVVAYMERASVMAGVAALLAGVPRILLCLRSLDPSHFTHYFPNGIDWYAKCLALLSGFPQVRFAANSRAGARACARWMGVPEERFRVIVNAAPGPVEQEAAMAEGRRIRGELGLRPGQPLVAGVFRLVPEKRPFLFLEAVRRLAEGIADLQAVLVGGGPMRDAVIAEVERLGLGERVHLVGPQPDGLPWIAAANLLLHTAAFEGMPNVHLEAQSLGRPVLGFAVGGVLEALAPALHPYALPDGAMDMLVEAGQRLLSDEAQRRNLGAAGSAFVKDFFGIERLVADNFAAAGLAVESRMTSLGAFS